jgi:hypothetical protein
MASGPKNYTVGTEKALFRLAKGTCYFPACMKPIIETVDGEPVVAVDTAHVSGAKPGSARYVESMTDKQRAAFDNLILLCVPHHKLVDRLRPNEYPIETLLEWKRANEPDEGIEILRALTESNLEESLAKVMKDVRPYREVILDVTAGVLLAGNALLTIPFESLSTFHAHNPHYRKYPLVVCVDIRNTGTAAVSLTEVTIHYAIGPSGAQESPAKFAYMGRNDFYQLNPKLPHRLLDGASVQWLMKYESLQEVGEDMAKNTANLAISAIYATVRLGSGESADSPQIPWSQTKLEDSSI